jgi:amidase
MRRTLAGLLIAAVCATTAIAAQSVRTPAPRTSGSFDPTEKSIADLQTAMDAGVVTSHALVVMYEARIRAYDHDGPRLNAMVAINPRAVEAADALDAERRAGHVRGPLHGIPIVIKDNYETADLPTTGGSLALAGFRTGRDAFMVKRLREAGAVIVGKTNLHELAAGITSVSSLGGQTRNPYDPSRNPGGSSGGTGAAVAASFAAAGMGSDTCGSIRIPSANNNLVGLRGTLGLSSRFGIIPLSHTQDIGGPLARSVPDLAVMLDATVGRDAADPTSALGEGHVPSSYRAGLRDDALAGARIGVLKSLFGAEPEDAEVTGVVRKALEQMKRHGAELVEMDIPGIEALMDGSSVIDAEFKFDLMDYLAQFPNAPVHSLGDIVDRGVYHAELEDTFKRRNAGTSRESDAYRRARVRRETLRDLVLGEMKEQRLEAIAYPVLRRRPASIGEPQRGTNCQLSAGTGLPAISMPAGFTADDVPIGVELLGAAWSEPQLLSLAYSYEQGEHPRRAPVSTPALIDGKAPPPLEASGTLTREGTAAAARFTLQDDVARGTLAFTFAAASGSPITSAVVRRAASEAIVAVLLNPAQASSSGELPIGAAVQSALRSGHAVLEVRTDSGEVLTARVALTK